MKGKLYLVSVKDMEKVPNDIEHKYHIVRSCKNSQYYTSKGWRVVPQLSPNPVLFSQYLEWSRAGQWDLDTFASKYRPAFLEQMQTDDIMRRKLNEVRDLLSNGYDVVFMCYCDSFLCHRFILGEQYKMRGYEVISL